MTGAALSATLWSYAQSWIARGLGLLCFLLLARLLSPGDFGAFAIAATILTLAETVLDQGLATALIQRRPLRSRHLNAAFWGALLTGALLALAAFACAQPLARWLRSPLIAGLMQALAPALLLMGLTLVPAARLRRSLNYQGLARRALIANLLAGAAAVLAAARGHGAWALVINLWVYQLVSLAVLWRGERWRPRLRFSPAHLRELFAFSGRVTGARLLDYAEARALEFWVARGLGLAALGQYQFAGRTAQAGQQVVAGPLWDSALGILSRLQADNQLLADSLLRLLALAAWLAFVPLALAIAAAPVAVPLVFGDKWRPAVFCLQALLLLAALRTPLFLIGVALQALGDARLALRLTGVRVLCTLAAVIWLAPRDIATAALALLAAQGVGAVFVLAAARRRLALRLLPLCAALAPPTLFCAAAGALVALTLRYFPRQWSLLLALGLACMALWALLALPAALRLRSEPPRDPV